MDKAHLLNRLDVYSRLTRLDKPVGIGLLLWPALWGLLLASNGLPDFHSAFVILFGVVLMRSAGCVINDYADRHVDGKVSRTRLRPFPAGEVTEKEALALFSGMILIAFLLVLSTNMTAILLSLPAAFLAAIYPFAKRWTDMPQLILGTAFSMAVPIAWAVVHDSMPPSWIWILFTANILWTIAYDTQYAMVDRVDDLQTGVRSTAILFGELDLVMIAVLQGMALFLLGSLNEHVELGITWTAGILISAGLFGWQHWISRSREPDGCFRAFRHNNLVGLCLTVGLFRDLVMV